jgi:putative flippase GtrA
MRSTERGSVPRFLIAGLVNTGVSYVAYLLLLRVAPYRTAFTIAFLFGILFSYALQSRFVFRRQAGWRSFSRFPFVYVAQYLAGLGLVSLLVEWWAVPAWLAPLLVLAVTIPLTYVLTRAVFKGEPHADRTLVDR